jgi:hypothetical protein
MSRILVISDTQAPAHHPNTIEFLTKLKKDFQPHHVVHIGDELDLRNLSKYVKDPDLSGPADELEEGLAFMKQLYDLFPRVQVCISNHGARPYLRAIDAGLPSSFIRSYREWMKAPKGWSWHHQIIIDDIAFIHGEGLSGDGARLKACTLMQRSCVFGHIHSHAGVSWFSNKQKLMFGFNVGCLIDLHSAYFEYNRHQLHRPIIGCGVIDNGVPTFIPMLLDKYGLWIDRKDKKNGKEIKLIKLKCPKKFMGTDEKCGSLNVERRGVKFGKQEIRCLNCNQWSRI